MSRKARKVQRVSAAARGLLPLPPDSILNSILRCSPVMSQENDSMTVLRAQEQEHLWIDWLKGYALNKIVVIIPPLSDLPEVCEPRTSKVSFVYPRTKKVSLQDRTSDWSKGLQNASPSERGDSNFVS